MRAQVRILQVSFFFRTQCGPSFVTTHSAQSGPLSKVCVFFPCRNSRLKSTVQIPRLRTCKRTGDVILGYWHRPREILRDHFAIVAHPPIVCLKSHAETPDGLSIIGAVDKETEIKESIEKRDRKQTSIAHREKRRAGNERIIGTAGTRDRR